MWFHTYTYEAKNTCVPIRSHNTTFLFKYIVHFKLYASLTILSFTKEAWLNKGVSIIYKIKDIYTIIL